MSELTFQVARRERLGKNEARRLRAEGKLPAVVYGGGKEPVPITLDQRTLETAFRGGAHSNTIFLLQLDGTSQSRHVMIREVAQDPIDRALLHVDFIRVDMDHKVKVSVSVELENTETCAGVKAGGLVDFHLREVEIECLPGDIPDIFRVDVKALEIGSNLRITDLGLDEEKIRVTGDLDRVIVSVAAPTKVAEGEGEGEGEEGVTEPELVGRGRDEEGED